MLRGECEETILALADAPTPANVPGAAWRDADGTIHVNGAPQAAAFMDTPPLRWPDTWVRRHHHHHHRFDRAPDGPGRKWKPPAAAPMPARSVQRSISATATAAVGLDLLLAEIDGLIRQGVRYLYFIDEIFLPQRTLLEALCERDVQFGVQTRIDLWKPEMIDLLGAGRLRLGGSRRREPDRGRTRRAGQEMPAVHG